MYKLAGRRFWFFLISGLGILIAIVALAVIGLPFGVDFSAGSLLTIHFENKIEQSQLLDELTAQGYPGAIIQTIGQEDLDFIIRTQTLSTTQKDELVSALTTRLGNLEVREFDTVSPMVASETAQNALIAMAAAAVGILLYVTFAFRKMPKPFRWGACGIIATVHDVVIASGIFAIFGAVFGWEVNLMFIIGILGILGYSINNTVVVFDRIRENMKKGISPDFEVVVNYSMVETLGRCLNTSLTTLITIIALMLFVGASIQNLVVVMLIGLIAGTWSSVCIAPTLLVVWETKNWGLRRSLQPAKAGGE